MRVPRTFDLVPRRFPRAGVVRNRAYLEVDNWDDWGRFATQYRLWVTDDDAVLHEVGWVKIGQRGMTERKPDLPAEFKQLSEEFFSLGQDLSYYESLNSLGAAVRNSILQRLRDIAANPQVFDAAINEDVTQVSLLRSVTLLSVEGQFRRAAHGLVSLTPYHFTFDLAALSDADGTPVLEFIVEPDAQPPTNVHAIIGSNGVGKSTILDAMARDLEEERQSHFTIEVADAPEPLFAGVVSISFSAFDTFDVPDPYREQSRRIRRANIGLRRADGTTLHADVRARDGLAYEFAKSFDACRRGSRSSLLEKVLQDLTSDPIFANDAYQALSAALQEEDSGESAVDVFSRLSTGHKVSLLALTRLVELVEERSLVLFDEPEAHLHPPLLAAFVRALTRLVGERNGVAILATHSPVVLQELPRACVYILRRSGNELRADRPSVETFGENLGTLTREVFGYEVTETGFHREIRRAVDRGESFSEIRLRFGDQLGSEALAIIRALTARDGD